jgi:hypothetical protein
MTQKRELFPRPAVHANHASFSAFSAADEDRAASLVEVGLGERQRFADSQSGSPENHEQRAQPDGFVGAAHGSHDLDDLLDGRRICGVAQSLVSRRTARVIARERGGGPLPSGGVKQRVRHGSSSDWKE